jgi:xanthine dehydrogenase/oxidase
LFYSRNVSDFDNFTLQNPTSTQEWAAHALGVPSHRVVCKVKRLGGGFGGKETRSIGLTSAVAVAAQNLDRPVKCVMERYQDMMFSGQRHPFYARYRVGVEPNGRLNALDVEVYSNGGWSHDLSMAVMDRALFHVDNVYKIPHMRVRGRIAKTNMPSNTAFRGFGGPQGMMINEMIMDHVIRQLNLPAAPTRRLNMYAPTGDKTHFGQSIEPFNVPRIWSDLLCRAEVSKREADVAAFNAANRYRKRGLCVLPTKFSCSFTAKFLNQGGALVLVYHDGSILVTHGGTEMGQGLHTKMAQIAATAFGVPLDVVHIAETATDKVANTSATAASMSSDINGAAVVDACNQILPRLAPYRQKFPQASFAEIVKKAYFDRVNLCAQGFHSVPWTGGYDWTLPLGTPQNPFAYFTHGVSVTEVEVDTLTGDHTVLRTDMMMDIGASLNPGVDVGQIEGAFMQGLGWCTLEELVFGDNDHPWVRPGHLFTQGPGSYKIPSFNDVPLDMRVYLLKDAPNPRAVHSSKAVGEPPLFMAASVFFAIKDAIAAAREENGLPQSWFQLHSPATSERIRMVLLSRLLILRGGIIFYLNIFSFQAIQDRLSLPFIANPETFVPKGSF